MESKRKGRQQEKAYIRTKNSSPVPILVRGVFYSTVTFKRQKDHKPKDEEILALEQEYRKPGMFPDLSIPILFTIICLLGSAMRIDWVYYVGTVLGLVWIYFSYRKRKQTKENYINLKKRIEKTFSLN